MDLLTVVLTVVGVLVAVVGVVYARAQVKATDRMAPTVSVADPDRPTLRVVAAAPQERFVRTSPRRDSFSAPEPLYATRRICRLTVARRGGPDSVRVRIEIDAPPDARFVDGAWSQDLPVSQPQDIDVLVVESGPGSWPSGVSLLIHMQETCAPYRSWAGRLDLPVPADAIFVPDGRP